MFQDFAAAYLRLSLLGVNNINELTECTAALPMPRPNFAGESVFHSGVPGITRGGPVFSGFKNNPGLGAFGFNQDSGYRRGPKARV
jgi:hypothetical protein